MKKLIIPSIIAESSEEMEKMINKASRVANTFQLDVMDGEFVKNESLNFVINPTEGFTYEAHLMMNDPIGWIEKNHTFCDIIIVHAEAKENLQEIIDLIKQKGKRPGIAINPETEFEKIKEYELDYYLVMTVVPGQYGSPFESDTVRKIKEIRDMMPNADIEVDGSINPETIGRCIQAGANRFVVGSYLMKAEDIKQNFETLKSRLL